MTYYFVKKKPLKARTLITQESIPVGCVPSAAVTGEGVCFPGECVCFLGGCVLPGVCASWGRGVVLPGGCAAWGVCFPGGCASQRGVYPSMHWGRHPHPVNRMTDRLLWKYYLAATSLRTVISQVKYQKINIFLMQHYLIEISPYLTPLHLSNLLTLIKRKEQNNNKSQTPCK